MPGLTILDRPDPRDLVSGGQALRVINLTRIPRLSPCAKFDLLLVPLGLMLHQCLAGIANGKRWASLPSRQRMEGGKAVSLDGRPAYEATASFADPERRAAFNAALLAAVDQAGGFAL